MDFLKKFYQPSLYEKIKDNGYKYSKIIIPELQKIIPVQSVLDVGCGGASFLHGCVDLGLEVFGVDGEHTESSLQIDKSRVEFLNLEEPFDLDIKFDLCVSTEVAEHIDNKFSDIFIDSICRHSDNVLFSAAQVGQAGINHINCQPLEYWIEKFKIRGYEHISEITEWINKNSEIYVWYRKNSMLFRKM